MEVTAIIVALVLPPAGPVFGVVAGLALCVRHPRVGSILAALSAIALYLLSTPAASDLLASIAGDGRAVEAADARRAQAIVVLAAGLSGDSTEAAGVTLGPLTLERVRYAVRLSKSFDLPIALSGGVGRHGLTEADLMRSAMIEEYALVPRWVESRSRNTSENAQYTTELLQRDGIEKVLLVTHPFDVRRARSAFVSRGLEVIAAPAQVPPAGELSVRDFLPSIWALVVSHYSTYELLALLRDRLVN
jgi:uncharacterized SAM-binding protein YcdF (DUF218 family)